MKQLEQKQKDYNWYFTQVFVRPIPGKTGHDAYSQVMHFVTFAPTPDVAKKLAEAYAIDNMIGGYMLEGPHEIHLYQKNYIRDSRKLVEAGKYAGQKPF